MIISKGVKIPNTEGSVLRLVTNIATAYSVKGFTIGAGRNDGINRIYVTGDDKHLYEYTGE